LNSRLLHINILDHPSNRNQIVFFFTENDHSDYFKQLLKEKNIEYEFQYDEGEKKYYFGISRRFESKCVKLNYLVFAKFREPFISSRIAKFLLIGVTLLFIILAIIGYIKSHL